MRNTAAIALILLGGGVTAMSVHTARRCEDPLTGQDIACPPGGHSGTSWVGTSHSSGGSGRSFGEIVRGGFGRVGAAMHGGS